MKYIGIDWLGISSDAGASSYCKERVLGAHLFTTKRTAAGVVWFVSAVIVLFMTSSAQAQATYTTKLQALDVTVAFDKTNIVAGEPVKLSITLENTSLAPMVQVSASFQFPEGNAIDLKVQPPGELLYRYSGALELGSYPAQPLKIVRGAPKTVEMLLLYDRTQPNGFLFSKAGAYQLSGEIQMSVNNAPIPDIAAIPDTEIKVSEPQGAEAEVFGLLNEPELVRALNLGIAMTTDTINKLEPITQKYPRTDLGALALRSVGQQLALADWGQREKGAALLQKYLENGIVAVDGDYTAWIIAAAYNFLGKHDLAREWVYYSIRNYPGSLRIRPEDALYKFYFFDPAAFAAQVPWYLLKEPWVIPGATPPTSLQPVQVDQ